MHPNDPKYPTAAHCVEKIPASWKLTRVRLGEWDLNKTIDCFPDNDDDCAPQAQDIGVAKAIVNPNYKKRSMNTHNDIALLRLKSKAVLDHFVAPICLPLDPSLWSTMDYTGHTFEVSGWGMPDSRACWLYLSHFSIPGKTENSTKSLIKLKVDLPFFPEDECQEQYQLQSRVIYENQVHQTFYCQRRL